MFFHLLYPLHTQFGVFNVFRYITFRTAMATLTAMVVSFALGPGMIRRLRQFQVGQVIRQEGPASHRDKSGTPTMGGVLILTATILPVLLWADLRNPFIWVVVVSTLLFGTIGFVDDYLKVVHQRSMGLTARTKFSLQVLVSLGLGLVLVKMAHAGLYTTRLSVPFFKTVSPELDGLYILFAVLVLAGSVNAVNLTDGLDGLAIGSVLIAAGTFAVLSYAAGHAIVSGYLGIPNVKGAGELTIFCGALVGASLGFLWFNCHPAEVFMGDVGSMAMGGALGTTAILIKQEILLLLVGGLWVLEALSVIVQVTSWKLRGKRVFRMSPIHHHFELVGWSETKVVIRFWIIALIFSLMSLATLKLR